MIDDNERVFLDGVLVGPSRDSGLAALVTRLEGAMAQNSRQPVILVPLGTTRLQRVIDVMDACAVAHVKVFRFGKSPPHSDVWECIDRKPPEPQTGLFSR